MALSTRFADIKYLNQIDLFMQDSLFMLLVPESTEHHGGSTQQRKELSSRCLGGQGLGGGGKGTLSLRVA